MKHSQNLLFSQLLYFIDCIAVIYCMLPGSFAIARRHLTFQRIRIGNSRFRPVSGLRYRMALPITYSGECFQERVVLIELCS